MRPIWPIPLPLPPEWRDYFDKLQQLPGAADRDIPHAPIQQSFVQLTKQPRFANAQSAASQQEATQKQVQVLRLISPTEFSACVTPILDRCAVTTSWKFPNLIRLYHGFTAEDMAVTFNTGSLTRPKPRRCRKSSTSSNRLTCGNVGVEYMHIINSEQKSGFVSVF